MCRKVVSVAMLLLASWVSCWGEARPSVSTDQRSSISKSLSQPPSTLWQIADESLTIIEESLIAQGEPVENLSKSLPELYQKSQELQESVNALSQRFGFFEEYLTALEKSMYQTIREKEQLTINLIFWKAVAISSLVGAIVWIGLIVSFR